MKILANPSHINKKFNPYTSLLYDNMSQDAQVEEYSHARALTGFYDILHYHWPDSAISRDSLLGSVLRFILLASIVLISKLKGTKIVWTVHNLVPHSNKYPRLSKLCLTWFARQCDGLIFLSETSRQAFQKAYPHTTAKEVVVPHGHYRSCYPSEITQAEARKKLSLPLEKRILLNLGMIKPYKNVPELIRCFLKMNDSNAHLIIAGKADDAQTQQIQDLVAENPEVFTTHLSFIADEKLPVYFGASDLVVLPYTNILNSGSVMLALSYNKPVLVPDTGSMRELQNYFSSNWINLFKGKITSEDIQQALNNQIQGQCPLDDFAWPKLSTDTYEFMKIL